MNISDYNILQVNDRYHKQCYRMINIKTAYMYGQCSRSVDQSDIVVVTGQLVCYAIKL